MTNQRFKWMLAGVFLVTVAWTHLTVDGQETSGEPTVDFATEIKPVFEASCVRCHGPEDEAGDFRIDDPEVVGYYIDPGDGEFSQLVELISTDDEDLLMPPPGEGERLSAETVAKITRWIDEGAVWPAGVTVEMPPPEVAEAVQEQIDQAAAMADAQKGSWELVWEIVGLLHPAIIHLPIGLLMGGALFALLGLRSESPLADAAYYCLWLGAWTAILACVSGWSFGIQEGYNEWQRMDWDKSIDIHRWGGILMTVVAFLLALLASNSRRRDPYGSGFLWKLGMLGLACLTGWIAHHGGKMVHTGLHDRLMSKTELLYSRIAGQTEAERKEKEQQQREQDEAANDAGNAEPDNGQPADTGEGNASTSGEEDPADNNATGADPANDSPAGDDGSPESGNDDASSDRPDGGGSSSPDDSGN